MRPVYVAVCCLWSTKLQVQVSGKQGQKTSENKAADGCVTGPAVRYGHTTVGEAEGAVSRELGTGVLVGSSSFSSVL